MGLPRLGDIKNQKFNNEPEEKELPKVKKISKLTDYDWGQPISTENHLSNTFADDGWIGFFNLDMVLSEAIEAEASDVHITPEQRVAFTVKGDIEFHDEYHIPDKQTMDDLSHAILNHVDYSEYAHERDYDFAYVIRRGPYEGRRFRGNIGRTFSEDVFVFRVISDVIPSMRSLGVEQELIDWSELHSGLWMICGPTGTGKSTTLASIIHHLQLTQPKKIITIEKPIEYTYPHEGKSLVVQREVGMDTNSFANGLTAAMRENPDVILIGEVRNHEEVDELLRAAESGHLAISTMHTNAVATTVNRIQSLFDGSERTRVLSTLSDTLKGLANQILLKDKRGNRFACREILTFNKITRKLVSDGDVAGLRDYQLKKHITMEDNLVKLVLSGKCSKSEARSKAAFTDDFDEIYRKNTWSHK